jgi:hypothetical protein
MACHVKVTQGKRERSRVDGNLTKIAPGLSETRPTKTPESTEDLPVTEVPPNILRPFKAAMNIASVFDWFASESARAAERAMLC